MKQKKSHGLAISLTALLLVLALAVTGLGSPAFILKIMDNHRSSVSYTKDQREVPEYVTEIQGNSRAVSLSTSDGFRLDAPENTFREDTDVVISAASDEQIDSFDTALSALSDDQEMYIFGVWNVDAGLESDEPAPGTFTMSWDLKELGIPEDMWDNMTVFRMDDSGAVSEYASRIQDGILTTESRQNSLYSLVANYCTWTRYVLDDDGTKRFVIYYKMDDARHLITQLEQTVIDKATEQRDDFLRRYFKSHGYPVPSGSGFANTLTMIRRYLADMRGTTPDKIITSDCGVWNKKKLDELQKQQPKYNEIQQMVRDSKNDNWSVLLDEISVLAMKAYHYVKSQGGSGFLMPSHVVPIILNTDDNNGGSMPQFRFAGQAQIKMGCHDMEGANTKGFFDSALLLLVHELTHACQREYKSYLLQNLKYDEAMAVFMEVRAKNHFIRTGDITTRCPRTASNLNLLQYLALPLDSYSVNNPQWGTYYGGSHNVTHSSRNRSNTGYCLAYFLNYLVKTYRPNANFHDLCSAYNAFATTASFTELMKAAFWISDEELDSAWHTFAGSMAGKLVRWSEHKLDTDYGNDSFAFGRHEITADKGERIQINDQPYTIRTRILRIIPPEGYTGNMALLLAKDEGFDEALPDLSIYPTEGMWGQCKYGMISTGTVNRSGLYRLIESDAGSDTGSSSAYTVYLLTTPHMDRPVKDGNNLKFKLPEMSAAARNGKIDGYRVRFTCSDGTTTDKHYKIAGAGKDITIKASKLMDSDSKLEDVSFTATVTEYINELGGDRTYGPESDLISSMEATLAEEGAAEGPITISLGWQTGDDLDLHVFTPDGSEIAFYSKYGQGGELDVDMQIGGDDINPAEHVVFQEPATGIYKVYVNTYTDRTEDYDTPFVVVVQIGNSYRKVYHKTATGNNRICSFEYDAVSEVGNEYLDE